MATIDFSGDQIENITLNAGPQYPLFTYLFEQMPTSRSKLSAYDAYQVREAVWNALQSTYTTSGTTGKILGENQTDLNQILADLASIPTITNLAEVEAIIKRVRAFLNDNFNNRTLRSIGAKPQQGI